MKGTIAIIGWGSLLWDADTLAAHVRGEWHRDDGPTLSLEFVRISPKRLNALTVVIDDTYGVPCPSSWIAASDREIAPAARALAVRERTELVNIGCVDVAEGLLHTRDRACGQAIGTWARHRGLRGAVWTDIPGNFHEACGEPFTPARAVAYLDSLAGAARIEAKRYIDSAPAGVDTPLRRLIGEQPWWHDIRY